MEQSISAVVLTKNEAKNIERCLSSLTWCDGIIIIDDYSEDNTIERIKNKKINIYKKHLERDFASQRNFGLRKAQSDWVLFIDADEVVSKKLRKEIVTIIRLDKFKGYYLKRQDYFLGKWLNYGETNNVKLLRLARKNAGLWQGRVHEEWQIKGKIGNLENPLLHYPHQSISEFLTEINWYTDLVAQYWMEQGRRIKTWEISFYPKVKFLQNYIFRLGFIDGIPGLIMALMMSFHSFLVRGKMWLLQHDNG